jgi:hypothetical protein
MDTNNKNWMEYFRLITPFMLLVFSFVGWSVNGRLETINERICLMDEKIFKHLTNEEIHTPRGLVVSQEAFVIYQNMRDKEMSSMSKGIEDIKDILLLRNKK